MAKISFNKKKHEYTINDKKLEGVTSFISKLFLPFEREKIAGYCSTSTKSAQEFMDEWDEATNSGSRVHKALENHVLGLPTNLKSEVDALKVAQGLKAFHEIFSVLSEPICETEVIVGSEELGLAGTIDLLITHNKDSSRVVTLVDWKTNKVISKSGFGKTGVVPATCHLADCGFVKYGLQLSFYAYILETEYGCVINNLLLVHLKEGSYEIIEIPYMRGDVVKILEEL